MTVIKYVFLHCSNRAKIEKNKKTYFECDLLIIVSDKLILLVLSFKIRGLLEKSRRNGIGISGKIWVMLFLNTQSHSESADPENNDPSCPLCWRWSYFTWRSIRPLLQRERLSSVSLTCPSSLFSPQSTTFPTLVLVRFQWIPNEFEQGEKNVIKYLDKLSICTFQISALSVLAGQVIVALHCLPIGWLADTWTQQWLLLNKDIGKGI